MRHLDWPSDRGVSILYCPAMYLQYILRSRVGAPFGLAIRQGDAHFIQHHGDPSCICSIYWDPESVRHLDWPSDRGMPISYSIMAILEYLFRSLLCHEFTSCIFFPPFEPTTMFPFLPSFHLSRQSCFRFFHLFASGRNRTADLRFTFVRFHFETTRPQGNDQVTSMVTLWVMLNSQWSQSQFSHNSECPSSIIEIHRW